MNRNHRSGDDAEVTGTLVHEMSDSWRIEVVKPGDKEPTTVRLMKSQCHRIDDNTWLLPEWLATKEGLI